MTVSYWVSLPRDSVSPARYLIVRFATSSRSLTESSGQVLTGACSEWPSIALERIRVSATRAHANLTMRSFPVANRTARREDGTAPDQGGRVLNQAANSASTVTSERPRVDSSSATFCAAG